jgi:hypothetical protein
LDTSGNFNSNGDNGVPVSNGAVSLATPPPKDPGETLCAVYFWIFTTTQTPLGTYTVKNFKLNGQPLGIDTTHLDDNPFADFAWCLGF